MKKIYEKPVMIVEKFVATQSVAANCGSSYDHDAIPVVVNQHICKSTTCGHDVQSGAITTYDGKYGNQKDGKVYLFSSSHDTCEYRYDDDAKGNVITMGRVLTGNGSWNSGEHAMVIGEVHIPS